MTDQQMKPMTRREFVEEARRLLAFFQDPVWAVTPPKTDDGHLKSYAETLAKTRHHFPDLPEKTEMHMVLGDGDVIFAITGNSPDAATRAQALVGFLRTMPQLLEAVLILEEFAELEAK